MAYLATLEGDDTGELLDRLFDCNDVLGVLIYGTSTWNKLKNFVANLATKEIALNRGNFGRWAQQYYNSNNDVLDRAFGFNNELGAALLGGENWGHFVNTCKTAAPVLGANWFEDYVVSPTKNLIDSLVPSSSSPEDIAKYLVGYKQIESAFNTAKDITGYSRQQREKAAAEAAAAKEEERQKELERLSIEWANAEADRKNALEIEAARAEAQAKKEIATDPEHLKAQTNNFLIFGGLGLAALLIATRRK